MQRSRESERRPGKQAAGVDNPCNRANATVSPIQIPASPIDAGTPVMTALFAIYFAAAARVGSLSNRPANTCLALPV